MHGVMRNLATGSYAVQLFRHHPNCRSRICSCAVRLQRVRCSHWCSSSSISDITSPRCTSAPLHKALNNKALHASKHLFSISCRRQTSSAEFSENATDAQDNGDESRIDELDDDLDDELDDEELRQLAEDDDEPSTEASTSTPNTEWGAKGLSVAEQVLQRPGMQELALYSFITSPTGKQLKIRLDKPSDEYGSPSLDELSAFSRAFADEYSVALGDAADDVAVEISSPGAERQVRLPQDLLRFQHLPMSVAFFLDNSDKIDTKILDLVSFDEQSSMTEWKLADVRQNRPGKGVSKLSKKQSEQRFKKALPALRSVHLHLEL